MILYVNMAAKTTTYPVILSHVYVYYGDTRLREITLLLMRWSGVVWRWLLCRQLYTMCILRGLATAIAVQVSSVRRWDWSNTVQNTYETVSLHGAIVKIIENRVLVNVYLQELCYILLVMNLWGITVKCTVYVGSLYLYGGPTSVTETVRQLVLLLCSYTICCFGDMTFTNKNHKVIRVWININTIHVMFYSLYYAVYNINSRISTPKYWNIFSFV